MPYVSRLRSLFSEGVRCVLVAWALSRAAFYGAALLALLVLPESTRAPERVTVPGSLLLGLPWRWDAIWYYQIAIHGYQPDRNRAFFPLFSLLVRFGATILGGFRLPAERLIAVAASETLLAGVLVTHLAALLAFGLLYAVARDHTGDHGIAQRSVFYAALFPLSFFFAVPYAEGLFLALTLAMFLAARRRAWLVAGLCVALAGAARPMGILLWVALAYEMWRAPRDGGRSRRVVALCLAPVGLLLFMLHLWWFTGDALGFVHAQTLWDRSRAFPLVTLWRGVRYVVQPELSTSSARYARNVMNVALTGVWLLVCVAGWRRWRPSWVVYGVLFLAFILMSPRSGEYVMQTVGRYLIVLFPVYITLAHWGRRRFVHWAILGVSVPLFCLFAALFVRWYFIA